MLGSKKSADRKKDLPYLQVGYGKQVKGIAPFFAASNGITLSKTPRAGLALGLVNCKEI